MKFSRFSLVLGAFASFAATQAQQLKASFPPPRVQAVPAPGPGDVVLHVLYDVQQDRIREVRSTPANEMELGTSFCFDNAQLSFDPNFDYYVVPNPGEELVDWGFKNCRESSLLRSITIGYGSSATATSAGGPGGTLCLALYQGTQGFGHLGTEVFRRTISGLPVTGGNHVPVLLTLDFGTQPVHLRDGGIGWGYLQLDGATGPFLVRAPRSDLGTSDALDLYAPGPAPLSNYQGTFNYGGCASPYFSLCASTWIQLEEIPESEVAGSIVRNGSGANPQLFLEILPGRLGQVWAGSIVALDPAGFRLPTLLFSSGGPLSPRTTPYGEILIDPAQRLAPPQLARGGYTLAIPADTTLAGIRLFLQGGVLDPARFYLTNALRVTLGY